MLQRVASVIPLSEENRDVSIVFIDCLLRVFKDEEKKDIRIGLLHAV